MPDPDVLWENPAHWTVFGYHCKADPRAVVPKRNPGMGWTLNWSNPLAVPVLFAMLAIAMGPMLAVVGLGMIGALAPLATILGAFIAVPVTIWMLVALCKRLSRSFVR